MPIRTYVIVVNESLRMLPLVNWLPRVLGFEEGDSIREVSVDEEVIIVPREGKGQS